MLHLQKFDPHAMAIKWCKYVDGKTIFPKLPVYLSNYHKIWQKNNWVRIAVSKVKGGLITLNKLNESLSETKDSSALNVDAGTNGQNQGSEALHHDARGDTKIAEGNIGQTIRTDHNKQELQHSTSLGTSTTFPPILHPQRMMQAPIHHVTTNVDADTRCIVGMTNIAPTYYVNQDNIAIILKQRGERGKDQKKEPNEHAKIVKKGAASIALHVRVSQSEGGFVNIILKNE